MRPSSPDNRDWDESALENVLDDAAEDDARQAGATNVQRVSGR